MVASRMRAAASSIAWVPWQRPGFDLGLKLGAMAAAHPEYVGVVLGAHGLFTWGETSKSCYETTLRIIQQAADWLAANLPTETKEAPKQAPPEPGALKG